MNDNTERSNVEINEDNVHIIEILKDLNLAAAERQGELRRLLIGCIVFVVAVITIFAGIIWNQSNSIDRLSNVLERRNPVITYLVCQDNLESARDSSQTNFLFALIDAGEEPTSQAIARIRQTRNAYLEAEQNLLNHEGCPTGTDLLAKGD